MKIKQILFILVCSLAFLYLFTPNLHKYILLLFRVLNPATYQVINNIEDLKSNKTAYYDSLNQFNTDFSVVELIMILKIRATCALIKSVNDHTIEIVNRITTRVSSMLSSPSEKPKTNRYAYNFASLYGGAIILDKTSNLKHVENIL